MPFSNASNMQKLLEVCKNRCLLFDNKTKKKPKKAEQLQKLLKLVDAVVEENDGQPYSHVFFEEMKVTLSFIIPFSIQCHVLR